MFNIKRIDFFEIFLNTTWFSLNYWYFLFQKIWYFFTLFCKTQNFGHLVWALRVAPELYDIGGSESIIYSPPSSNGLVILQLLASRGRKKHIFFLHPVDGINTFKYDSIRGVHPLSLGLFKSAPWSAKIFKHPTWPFSDAK